MPNDVTFVHSSVHSSRHSSGGAHVQVLTVRGELDIASLGAFQRELGVLIDSGTRVLVDLSGVEFMDSSALSALVSAHERARLQGCHLALAHPSPACSRVLGITGLDRVFETI